MYKEKEPQAKVAHCTILCIAFDCKALPNSLQDVLDHGLNSECRK